VLDGFKIGQKKLVDYKLTVILNIMTGFKISSSDGPSGIVYFVVLVLMIGSTLGPVILHS